MVDAVHINKETGQITSFNSIGDLFESLTPEKPIPVLEPGDVLGYWDMCDMPRNITPGAYITQDGRVAIIEYVSNDAMAFGYVRETGMPRSCVWEFMGLVVCSQITLRDKNDKYIEGVDLTCRWEDGITSSQETDNAD